jgi:SAM-dependent methyltransferase
MTVAPTNPPLANLDEYADPDHYDQENPAFEPDGPFYQELAQRLGAAVLELGCGTGRLTIPLARARRKAGNLPIRWVEADARSLALGATFDLILDTGEVMQHALTRTEHEAILARVREHLAPQGRFVTSALLPRAGLITDQDEHPWFDYADAQGRHVQVSGTVRYDPLEQVYHEDAIRRWREADGREVTRLAPLARRLFFPQELEALLHYNGFAVVERYGDWDGAALERESPRLIFVCAQNG